MTTTIDSRKRATLLGKLTLAALMIAMGLIFAAPADAQVLLLSTEQSLPLTGVLDDPCTPGIEAITFSGGAILSEKVWQMPSGNLRLQLFEKARGEGEVPPVIGQPAGPKYYFSGGGDLDVELAAQPIALLGYHKVTMSSGIDNNFHVIAAVTFNPTTLKLDVKLEGACDNGAP